VKKIKVLYASSEAYPLIKTGGLADVAGHLPLALHKEGVDITVAIPGYPSVLEKTRSHIVAYLATFQGYALIRETRLKQGGPRLWIVDHPLFSQRDGNPYGDDSGSPWPDNALRFGLFSHVLTQIATGKTKIKDQFDIVHCNDWQTGLIPAYLSLEPQSPASIFTIHNLAYQGLFPLDISEALALPEALWSSHGLEFHGFLSFIKGGLVFADHITTVSASYAEEIQSVAFGNGLAGLLHHRRDVLHGIINGIDTDQWNPAKDSMIPARYSSKNMLGKAACKKALQSAMGLDEIQEVFLLGNVGRLVEQKGIDIILDALPELIKLPIQIVIVGTGDKAFETALQDAALKWPDKLACHIGYDEKLAHLLEAGSDAFLMPSRFEPCGLNQMYSQAYGTPPIVSQTGGLLDTVIDATKASLKKGTASGFYLPTLDEQGLLTAIENALDCYQDLSCWEAVQLSGMKRDFSWKHSGKDYISLYQSLVNKQ
jgi:starch synthase